MGVKLIPPKRTQRAIGKNGIPALRLITFLEDISKTIEALPEIIPDITDLAGPADATANMNKINEILAAMRTAGLMG